MNQAPKGFRSPGLWYKRCRAPGIQDGKKLNKQEKKKQKEQEFIPFSANKRGEGIKISIDT